MPPLVEEVREVAAGALSSFRPGNLLDILIIAFIFYWLLLLLRGTTAMAVLRGAIALLLMAHILGSLLQLTTLNWLLRNSLPALLVAVPVLFQPELRRALERIGRTNFPELLRAHTPRPHIVDIIVAACQRLSGRRVGAIIVVERETGLEDHAETGVRLDAAPSVELLLSIFQPGSPLHDGAVIMREDRVIAAGCVLPIAESAPPDLGTRHRAAIGITEQTDAVAVVVSEETRQISLAHNGQLHRNLSPEQLRAWLVKLLGWGDTRPPIWRPTRKFGHV